jgi:histidinol-phosphate/aromatic aminotransferase/cobyric acid decarboxylase-like protein
MFERQHWLTQQVSDERINLSNNICYDQILQNQVMSLLGKNNITFSQYEDESKVYKILSEFYEINPENIAIGFGLGELIPRIFNIFKDKNFSIVTPTWMMATGFCNVQNIHYIEGLEYSSQVLYIANPNGMTGKCVEAKELEEYSKKFEYVIVDEAYNDFCDHTCSMVPHSHTKTNIIVTKTFSKSLSLPGLRFGYCFSSKSIIKKIQDIRPSGSVNSIVGKIGKELLELKDNHIQRMVETRSYIENHYDCVQSQANFVLLKNKEKFLDYFNYRKIENLYRISLMDIGTFKYYETISNL